MKFSHTLGRLRSALWATPAAVLMLSSCIADEKPSMEADIEAITISGVDATSLLASPSESQRSIFAQEDYIVYHLAQGVTDSILNRVQLDFKLTEGAHIALAEGTASSFTNQAIRQYVVTSEDGAWKRTYKIQFIPAPTMNTKFNFDTPLPYVDPNADEEDRVTKFYQWPLEEGTTTSGGSLSIWGTGNAGFMLSAWDKGPEEYPTVPTSVARSGKAVQLTTRSTGALGAMFGKPIAAGNLFIGTFDLSKAFGNALEGTLFGRPFNRKPLRIKGYYKWAPGAEYKNVNQEVVKGPSADGKDLPNIYAVLYRNVDADGKPLQLDGTNILTHINTIGIAMVKDFTVTGVLSSSPWVEFDAPFVYSSEPSLELLTKNGYNLALVFSSSRDGAKFEGAVGSTLIIDDVEIVL